VDEYLLAFKNKKKKIKTITLIENKTKLKAFISRFLIAVIFFLVSIIFANTKDDNLLFYKEHVFSDSVPFMKIKNWYESLFGEVLPDSTLNAQTVFSGKIIYKEINDYLDGEVLTVQNKSVINNLSSGVVVFKGEKEGYGNIVIIQGIDGYDIWYGNLDNISINLYDYIETKQVIGETLDDKLYLVIKKDNEYIKYEDYQNK
jgi:stage IV sporulation protein FA